MGDTKAQKDGGKLNETLNSEIPPIALPPFISKNVSVRYSLYIQLADASSKNLTYLCKRPVHTDGWGSPSGRAQ